MNRTSVFAALLFTILTSFSLKPAGNKPGLELEITYDYNHGFRTLLSGIYTTDYIEGKISIDHNKNFSIKALPAYKKSNTDAENALATAMAISLTVGCCTLLMIAKKELERKIENQNIHFAKQRCENALEKSTPNFEKLDRIVSNG